MLKLVLIVEPHGYGFCHIEGVELKNVKMNYKIITSKERKESGRNNDLIIDLVVKTR